MRAAAIMLLFISGTAVAGEVVVPRAAGPARDGLYCVNGDMALFAARRKPNGALRFGLRNWTSAGASFLVAGVAQPTAEGWRYTRRIDAPAEKDRCGVEIIEARGVWRVGTIDGARCETMTQGPFFGPVSFAPRALVAEFPETAATAEGFADINCGVERRREARRLRGGGGDWREDFATIRE